MYELCWFRRRTIKNYKNNFKNQYPEQLIRIKIHKFLETHKINNLTFKQEQTTNNGKQSEKNSEVDQCSYFTIIYLGNCSPKFQ